MTTEYVKSVVRYGDELSSYADFFRAQALNVDANPDLILQHVQHPALQFLLNDRCSSALERINYLEAYAYGDPGVMLACPGPSLSGLMIRELGTSDEVNEFYDYLRTRSARTFFALTEPNKGSDAGALQCNLTFDDKKGVYLLNGEKCLFGNAAVGDIGVILARVNTGVLGVRAVKITSNLLDNANYIQRHSLKMTGLRAAQIGYMKFTNCPIEPKNILGSHLSPMQQGMMAVIKTFNRLRTGVGALAIGQAQALLDFTYENRAEIRYSAYEKLASLFAKLASARKLIYWSSKIVDAKPECSREISIAKVQATKTAEEVIINCVEMLSHDCLIHNEWVTKCLRDCFAWEFMEGTRVMQYKNVFNDFFKKNYRLPQADLVGEIA